MKTINYPAVWAVLVLVFAGCSNSNNPPPAAVNNAPVAVAGADQASDVLVGDVVVLDGSASSDADGDTLTYIWTLTAVPADSTAALSDPFSDKPTFVADKAGTYIGQLTVNDAKTDSEADDVNVIVVVPAPTVVIATPENQSVTNASPIAVTGTVDDPLAEVSVNGNATPNNNGAYSANVTLAEGENTVTVVATNSTGDGTASVDVTLRTVRGPGPAVTITSPNADFTVGAVWDGMGVPPSDSIPVKVTGTITPNGSPSVTVNDVAATIGAPVSNPLLDLLCRLFPNPLIPTPAACDQRFSFSADILLSKGQATITAVGQDTVGSTTVTVNGVADYCQKGAAEPGGRAERGDGQNNRCHEIDGCNRNKFGRVDSNDTNSLRNQPMPEADHNAVLVEFGSGYIPATDSRNDFFVHGQRPARALGCNIHDNCYQTCVPRGEGDRIAAFNACNAQQLVNHKEMCRKAYPVCPYSGLESFKCVAWAAEKGNCFVIADIYYSGVSVGGGPQYDVRQNDYCAS